MAQQITNQLVHFQTHDRLLHDGRIRACKARIRPRMARQANTGLTGNPASLVHMGRNELLVCFVQIMELVPQFRMIHKRKNTTTNTEHLNAIIGIPFHNLYQISGVSCSELTTTIKAKPRHTKSAIRSNVILLLNAFIKG